MAPVMSARYYTVDTYNTVALERMVALSFSLHRTAMLLFENSIQKNALFSEGNFALFPLLI